MLGVLLAPMRADAILFGEFGLQEEMEMGRELEQVMKTTMPIIEDPEIQGYVQGIVDRIVSELPPQPYKFPSNVVLHDSLNAFAAPGGFVFVFSGLIMKLNHESELAGVLAHEIAHVTQRHIAGRIERGRAISIASLLGMLAGVAAGAAGGGSAAGAAVLGSMAAGSAAMLNYSRVDEDDADRFGLKYLVDAGYDPKGLSGAFEVLRAQDWNAGSAMPTYLSSHPDLNMRLASLRADLATMPSALKARKNDDRRFHRIQTLLWARHGDAVQADRLFRERGDKDAVNVMGKAMLAARQNRVKDAAKLFARALKLAPKDDLVLREAGIFEYTKGDQAKARRYLEQAIRLAPRDYYGLFFYARLLDDSGRRAEAQEHYRTVLRYVPQDSEVHMYYGRSLGASGRTCEGFLHLAYSAMYAGDERRASAMAGKAEAAAKTDAQREGLERYRQKAKEHAKILKSTR